MFRDFISQSTDFTARFTTLWSRHFPEATVTTAFHPRSTQDERAPQISSHRTSLTPQEAALLAASFTLLAVMALVPSVGQPSLYHAFADQRHLLGIPNMMDVLSNLAFAILGALGLWGVHRQHKDTTGAIQRRLAGVFYFGLLATAALSGWYHLDPHDNSLAIDRLGMTIAFAGLLGLAASTQVSDRAGLWVTLGILLLGPWSITTWLATGNLQHWVVLQFGGLAILLGMGCLRARDGALQVSWLTVVLVYAFAKLLEHTDLQIYELTDGLVSGHTLKHLVASCAALPIIAASCLKSTSLESAARGAMAATTR